MKIYSDNEPITIVTNADKASPLPPAAAQPIGEPVDGSALATNMTWRPDEVSPPPVPDELAAKPSSTTRRARWRSCGPTRPRYRPTSPSSSR